ncbi:hypothetical protein HD597_003911 [Nonomuraea thailandensis]|uniref:Uncharacterized protein n=1 Tax=Nonomuraea thailandensis TaxID=1188745 RepID=A0A9X2K4S4_9ACTN|nr:hypothetical protein [Nonomuraea thailandensis]MCP2356891.1 hypothetical protein [Nonomuraea thailandensis]
MDFIRLPATRLFLTLLAEAVETGSPIREHYARLHTALRQGVRARVPEHATPSDATPEALTVLLVGDRQHSGGWRPRRSPSTPSRPRSAPCCARASASPDVGLA